MWSDIEKRGRDALTRDMTEMLESGDRVGSFNVTFGDLLFDYSKTQMSTDDREALLTLARQAKLAEKRDAMFNGHRINETEGRAVLHTALRNLSGRSIHVDLSLIHI